MNSLGTRALKIHERLLEFYGEPIWRNPLPAIDELVSTILSQNTNDLNRDRAFNALRAKFETWEEVRDADALDVVNAIRPAGLANQKGPRIQQVLRSITEERGNLDLSFLGDLSVDEAKLWLTKFNGVGPKTAAIVLCFSLGKPAFPVDTHIHRLMTQWKLTSGKNVVETERDAKSLFPEEVWNKLHLQIIFYGREYSPARGKGEKDFITKMMFEK